MDNLLFACFAGRLGGGFVGVMIGQACAWADVGLCPRVGANEAPCVWRRGWWGGAKRGASWRLAHGTAPGSYAALFGAWMVRRFAARLWRCRCFAQCQPGLRAGGNLRSDAGLNRLKNHQIFQNPHGCCVASYQNRKNLWITVRVLALLGGIWDGLLARWDGKPAFGQRWGCACACGGE